MQSGNFSQDYNCNQFNGQFVPGKENLLVMSYLDWKPDCLFHSVYEVQEAKGLSRINI